MHDDGHGNVLALARQELLAALPQAIQRALASYTAFASSEAAGIHEDAKTYAAHHAGLKAALAHLEALLKLGRLIVAEDQLHSDTIEEPGAGADTLPSLIEKAQATLRLLDQESGHDDG
jgi:hypothetical protein